jgi:hypothetical protein
MRASLACAAVLLSCSGGAVQNPAWTRISVDHGQGQVNLVVRYRWVADRDRTGVTVSSPEGGKAFIRVFFCGKPTQEVQELIRRQLRGRLQNSEFVDQGRGVFSFRYLRGKLPESSTIASAAVAVQGPILVGISSANFDMQDLVDVARHVRLTQPVASIPGCFPLCEKGTSCVPQGDDEG